MRSPDQNDADIVLKLYELRREEVMRRARKFWFDWYPKNFGEVKALLDPKHDANAFFRQVSSYWEMAASFVNRGILHPEIFADNGGEGLFVLAKMEPFLPEIRDAYNPSFLQQIEKAAQDHPPIREKLGRVRERVQKLAQRRG